MIRGEDRLSLPAGVELGGGRLLDVVRGAALPVNPAGQVVLAAACRGATVAEAAQELGERFGLAPARALDDVRAFAAALNAQLLLNVTPRRGELSHAARNAAMLVTSARVLVRPRLELPAERRALPTRSPAVAAVAAARGVAARALAIGLATALAMLVVAGALLPHEAVVTSAALGAGIALSVVVHEAGHALLLPRLPAALGVVGLRAFVMHPPLPPVRRAAVAAGGPLAAAAAGLLLLLASSLAAAPALALVALPLVAQIVALTIPSSDGRKTCGLS